MQIEEAIEQAIAEEFVWLRGPRLQDSGPYKVWVTTNRATNACKFCRRLHGVRRSLGVPFPYDHALPWWSPGVDERNRPIPPGMQPPRHPNCRCTLVSGDAFAADPDAAVQAATVQQQALSASIDTIAQQAYDAWQASGNQAAHHLYVTLRVSQNRPLAEVLAQPDVQAVLRRPFEHATDLTREAIEEAWIEGAAHGHAAGNQDLQIAGFEPIDPVEIDQDPLNRLLDDAQANGDAAYQRFRDSIQSQDPDTVRDAIRHATQDQALRARSGADVAGKTASSLAKLATLTMGLIGS